MNLLPIPAPQLDSFDRLFGSPDGIVRELGTLCRLTRLHGALPLPADMRGSAIGSLVEVFKNTENSFRNALVKQETIAPLYPLTDLSDDQVKIVASRVLKDLASLAGGRPVTKPSRGARGPTFLVSYSRTLPNCQVVASRDYVLKSTSQAEIDANLIYDAFSTRFKAPEGLGFWVPKTAGLDLVKRNLVHPNCTNTQLSPGVTGQLSQSIDGIGQAHASGQSPLHEKPILISKRIRGENLFDFACSKYAALRPEHKQKLFERMGRLAVLDLVLGNLDRLARIGFDEAGDSNYEFSVFEESNLGNLMIDLDENSQVPPYIFLIDNEVEPELFSSDEKRKAYLKFLGKFFSDPEKVSKLTNNIRLCLISGFNGQADDAPGNVVQARGNLTLIKKDLAENGLAVQEIQKGIFQMMDELPELFERWELDSSLQNYLQVSSPQLLGGIQERIETCRNSLKNERNNELC